MRETSACMTFSIFTLGRKHYRYAALVMQPKYN